jgi:hypothetical protein
MVAVSVLVFPNGAGAQISVTARATDDWGGGTYVATGRSYDFILFNSGPTAWRSFYVVAPPGMSFLGGTTGNEASAHCVVGQPNGSAAEIECGPLAPGVIPPQGRLAFVAATSASSVCGVTFELFVSSANDASYTRAADVTEAADCEKQAAPRAVTRPTLHGTPSVGSTIRATAPTWTSPPTLVRYQWQRCVDSTCAAIAGATGLTLVLTRRDAGHAVRLVAMATIAGRQVRTNSRMLAVPARRV